MRQKKGYIAWGVTLLCVGCGILLFYDTLFGLHVLPKFCRNLLNFIAPILYGAFMAYLLAPTVNFYETVCLSEPIRIAKSKGRMTSRFARFVSILLTWATVFAVLYILAHFLLPELYRSVLQLFNNAETYYYTILHWVDLIFERYPHLEQEISDQLNKYYGDVRTVITQIRTYALPRAQIIMNALSGGVLSLLIFLKNLLIGIIVSVYFLFAKERCAAHARKVAYSLFPREWVSLILQGAHRADRIFSGFVRGKLLDSLIIFVICLVSCSLLKFPYTPLVSAFVGITNMIPFFGPFLGAIPSTFLILLVSPLKAVYFVIFILILQQVDGNIIGPKILGDSTGISGMWVILAILVGGGFFGVAGMFFAVPVCACLYSLVTFLVDRRLAAKQMPVDTIAYTQDTPDETPTPRSDNEP